MAFSLFNLDKQIQKINVGGQIFTTTSQTFSLISSCCLPDFGGPMKDGDGNVFIDRDGELFGYILNFCRNQKLILPEDFSKFELLEEEAEYYGLHTLVDEIKREKQMKGMKPNQEYHYFEVVEVRTREIGNDEASRITTHLNGRKTDIMALPASILGKEVEFKLPGYTKVELYDPDSRIILTEYFSNAGWNLENADMSSSCTSYMYLETPKVIIEQTFRDRWKKNHNK